MHACMLSHFSRVWHCETLWTAAHQAPLSMGFSRQEYWSELPFPSPSNIHAHILTEFLYHVISVFRLWKRTDSFGLVSPIHYPYIFKYMNIDSPFFFCCENCHIYNFNRSCWQFDQAPCPDWILPRQGLSSNLTHICFPLGNINLSFLEWTMGAFKIYFSSICL